MAKQAKRPRPNKNSDGQDRKPSMSRSIQSSPGKPPEAPAPPGAPPPGAVNPMTHPQHPGLQASVGSAQPQDAEPQRQIRETIQFKDLPPTGQSQAMKAMGMDPAEPQRMLQQNVDQAMAKGPSQGPIPNVLAGPGVPPELASFPDDIAHLSQLMQQGYAPGASGQEHELAMNAHAMARHRKAAFEAAQNGTGAPAVSPSSNGSAAGPIPGQPPGPPLQAGIGASPDQSMMQASAPPMIEPPQQQGAPGGIPPELIAQLMEQAKRKRPMR